MKKNHKLILGSVLAVALLSLTACGPKTDSQSSDQTTSTPTTQESTPSSEDKPSSEDSTPSSEETPSTSENIGDKYDCITIAEAIEIAKKAGEEPTAEKYFVYGIVKNVKNPMYGEMTIEDETGSIYVFGIEGYSSMKVKPLAGDEIVIKGQLKTFNGQAEFGRSELVDFKHVEEEIDESKYKEMNIAAAREEAVGEKVKLTGVVAQITYGQGYVPNGFYLIDDTESIYVYDADAVQRVEKGNKVTVIGERANYINSKEIESAHAFGYQGCIQITNVKITKNDNGTNEFDTSWIQDSTVKTIVETPTTVNITTSVFKVTAYVKKAINPGFTNYYINDLDGVTGSYVYTSSNGNDFKWLDPFDGKLCDILLSPINCKCTSAGITYRFIPLQVKESNYKMEDKDVPQFALDYTVYDQFLDEYNANPNLEVITKVSNEKLGFQDVAIEYTSDKPETLDFVKEADKVTMVTKKVDGVAKVTMKATYKGFTAEVTKNIKVKNVDVSDAVNVKGAIDAEDGETVKVKGVVMSSLVNKDGFYIADETGVIAVTTTKEDLAKIKLGNLVCMEGTKVHNKKPETQHAIGQAAIVKSKLVLNEFGEHKYSTASFINDKKIEEINDFNALEDHSTEVYTVKGKLNHVKGQYSDNMDIVSLTNPKAKLELYCANAGTQYKWLKEFEGKDELTFEIALCNWNDKDFYKATVISVNDGTKTVVNSLNFR